MPQESRPCEPAPPAGAAGAAAPVPQAAGLAIDLAALLQQQAQLRVCSGAATLEHWRDPSWQCPLRQLENQVRQRAVALAAQLRAGGVRAGTTAALLGVPARTLRAWQLGLRGGDAPALLGRPPRRCAAAEAEVVIDYLHGHGPHVGLPSLRATFAALPRVALQDLLDCYRHLWLVSHQRERTELRWLRVGAVWAVDFTEVSRLIDGRYGYVLAVRDLASGQQLAWRAVADMTAQTAARELDLLFLLHGAPLVLKSDNGSAFRAWQWQRLLGQWGVWPLYSPPGQPWYNGAIEASIGSLKNRTQFTAWRHGHEEEWTSADLAEAQRRANERARPRRGTAAEEWAGRRALSTEERVSFGAEVRRLEEAARRQGGVTVDAQLDHYEQAALHREVLESVLVQRGLLLQTRRRIPQRIFGRKTANFR